MECREAQSLIVPFIKNELPMEQVEQFLKHIANCKDCKEELEIYYILMFGLQQLDEENATDLNLHGQFEARLAKSYSDIRKRKNRKKQMYVFVGMLIVFLTVLAINARERNMQKRAAERDAEKLFEDYKLYRPFEQLEQGDVDKNDVLQETTYFYPLKE